MKKLFSDQFVTQDFSLSVPLCVDLDGTLIKEHSLWLTEGLYQWSPWIQGLKTKSWSQFKWAMGNYALKKMPILHNNVLEKILKHRQKGGFCFLVTGSPWFLAKQIDYRLYNQWGNVPMAHGEMKKFFLWMNNIHQRNDFPLWSLEDQKEPNNFFHGLLTSSPWVNLVGQKKAQCLCEIFKVFDYIGNSNQDLWVWKQARKKYVVGPNALFLKKKAFYQEQMNLHILH